MKPRERFYKALDHEEPDRVPLDYWTTPQAYEGLRDHLAITSPETQEWGIMSNWKISEEILQRLHVDFRRVYMNPAASFESKTYPDGSIDTEFACRMKWLGEYLEVVYFPWAEFNEVKQVEEFEWIDPDDPTRMDGVAKWAKHLHDETDYAVTGMVGGPWAVFEIVAHYMRGFEKFLLDLTLRKDLAIAMMDKSMELALEMNRVLLDEVGDYLDVVQVGDDLGHQHGLIMSPKMYRELVKPRHKKIFGDIHKRAPNVKLLYHTCGAIEPMINDLIEVGVDILNPVQPLAKGMESHILKEKYGDRITFHGGIDLQNAMSEQGNISDLEKEIDTRLKAFAPGGGYILAPAHNIQPDSTPEKILHLFDYAEKKGRYPITV
ncbi:MAG: uroporphyrinogen decarboxylase family protein [Candidatus Thorarchaeota archaeon]|jgi:uroporphyrinogen decarboxylase